MRTDVRHLNGIDHMFWALETDTTTGVMGGLIRFEPTLARDRPDAAFVRTRIGERLAHLPPLRWRMATVPLGLDHSYLAETQRIDLDHHVRTVQLPAPGGDAELAAEVARLMGQPLDTGRPLWELIVLDGLADGSVAHLLRVHHVVLDGGSMPVLIDLLSDSPVHPVDAGWHAAERVEPIFGSAELLARGVLANLTRPLEIMKFAGTMTAWYARRLRRDTATTFPAVLTRLTPGELARPAAAILNVRQKIAGAPLIMPLVPKLRAPSTPFNKPVTSKRAVAYTDLGVARMKAIGKPSGCTLNDVVVALCAGALRRYLDDHGGAPAKPLILCVPVGLRDPKEPFRWANDVSMLFCEFPTHLADPRQRLEFARRSVKEAKANLDQMPMEHYQQASEFVPPQTFAIPAKIMGRLPRWVPTPAPWNVVVSNVRGPAQDVHVGGHRITGIWPTSFLSPVGGVNITLQSYVDRVDFAVVACGDHVDDLDSLVDHLHAELAVLEELAGVPLPG